MALPIDPKKIKDVADEVMEDLKVEVNVNVYVDTSASPKLIDSISKFLQVADANVNLQFIDLDNKALGLDFLPDFGLIIAGSDKYSVLCYKALQIKKIPALIICLDPSPVIEAANSEKAAVEVGDLICPAYKTYSMKHDSLGNEIIDFDFYSDKMDKSIKSKMVDWMYLFSEAAQISYALHFPFLRPAISRRIINASAIENAGLSILKILPGIDMPLCIANQVKMILELAAIYGYDISIDRIIEIFVVILSSIGVRELSNVVKEEVPVPKFIIDGVFGFAGTELLGFAAREWFSRGLAPKGLVEKCKSLFKR